MPRRPRARAGPRQRPERPRGRDDERPAPPEPALASSAWRPALLWLALAAVTLAVYQPAWHGGLLWDDDAHLTAPGLRSFDGLWRIWFEIGATQQYYPLVHSAFWLMHRLWGDSTLGYHLVPILLHATSAWLVVVTVARLSIPGALLAGFAFALHPVHVESVAWMTELKNTLSTVLYLGSALFYLRFDERRESRDWYRSVLLFVLALLSKTVTATLPVALLIVFWWKRGAVTWRRDVRPLVPFLVLAVAGGTMTAWVEYSVIGASGTAYELGGFDRVLLAGRAVWFYLASLVWPTNLVFIYPRWTISATVWWQWLPPLALAATVVVFWRLRGRTRAPLAALLLFIVTLGPALGFVNVYPFRYSFVADHFQYVASICAMAALAAAATAAAARWIPSPFVRAGVAAVLLGPLAVVTWQLSHHYAGAEALFRSIVARNPSAWMAHSRLALIEAEKPQPNVETAVFHAREAVRFNPRSAEVHDTLGLLLQHQGKLADARAAFETATRLNPALPGPHVNLGMVAHAEGRLDVALGRLDDSIAACRRALQFPENATLAGVRNNFGITLAMAGRAPEARAEFREALRLDPNLTSARENLARVGGP